LQRDDTAAAPSGSSPSTPSLVSLVTHWATESDARRLPPDAAPTPAMEVMSWLRSATEPTTSWARERVAAGAGTTNVIVLAAEVVTLL
jgi:hypothetical protein